MNVINFLRETKYKRLLYIVIIIFVFLIWRFGFPTASKKMTAPNMGQPPVRVSTALAQDMPYFLNGLGSVVPSGDVLVKSRVDGQLIKLHFREGQRVKAGDLLAEIDPRPFQATLDQAQGNLEKDQAQLENAKNDLNRYAKLAKNDFIAAQQYETQRALVRQYEGVVEADKAQVNSAKLQLEYSKITAPIGGRLGLRNVDEGNQIKSSDSNGIVRITETNPCDVIFTLPEAYISTIIDGMRESRRQDPNSFLLVQAWDREQKQLLTTGYLLSLDNQIDSTTGTVKLKARFNNEKYILYPNQFVNARLLVRILKNAVTVPSPAVQLGARGSYVYVVKNDVEKDVATVHLKEVKIGVTTDRLTVIDSGLDNGEIVVVDGLDRLRDGISVKVAATMEIPKAEAIQ